VSKRSKAARAPPGAGAGVKRDKRFAATPGFLAGGDLHGYQVEGVNWLCHAWDRRQHVILADEMGLGAAVGAHAGPHRLPACPPCQPPLAVALRSGILAVARIACMDGTSEHVCHWAAIQTIALLAALQCASYPEGVCTYSAKCAAASVVVPCPAHALSALLHTPPVAHTWDASPSRAAAWSC